MVNCPKCGKLVAENNVLSKKYHFDNCKYEPIEGLGDVIKKITNFIGIETCDSCEERRKKLNKLFPYTKTYTIETTDIDFIKRIKSNNLISYEDKIHLFSVYNRVFRKNVAICNCSGLVYDMIDKLWNIYLANHSKNINE